MLVGSGGDSVRIAVLGLTTLAFMLSALGQVAHAGEPAKPTSTLPPTTMSAQSPGQARYVIGKPYQFDGVWYRPAVDYGYDAVGLATTYGPDAAGQPTVNGESYDPGALTAAHKTLPLPSLVRVTNPENGRTVELRVNDRGPFVDNQIIMLSRHAADALGIKNGGVARVRVQIMADESRVVAAALRMGAARSVQALAPVSKPAIPEPAPVPAPPPIAAAPPISPRTVPVSDPAPSAVAPNRTVAAAEPQEPALNGRFYIQAGAFRDVANAERLRAKLSAVGHATVFQIELGAAKFSCVRIGPIASKAEAERMLREVLQLGQKGAWLVSGRAG
jgi:rare lipoprotein A